MPGLHCLDIWGLRGRHGLTSPPIIFTSADPDPAQARKQFLDSFHLTPEEAMRKLAEALREAQVDGRPLTDEEMAELAAAGQSARAK